MGKVVQRRRVEHSSVTNPIHLHRGGVKSCPLCNFEGPASICTCGHHGDNRGNNGDTWHQTELGAPGHGKCIHAGCFCQRFTWKAWTPKYAAAMKKAHSRFV